MIIEKLEDRWFNWGVWIALIGVSLSLLLLMLGVVRGWYIGLGGPPLIPLAAYFVYSAIREKQIWDVIYSLIMMGLIVCSLIEILPLQVQG